MKKWYEKDWGIILLCVMFFPVGLYLVWKKSDWTKRNKVIATLSVIVLAAVGNLSDKSKHSSSTFSDTSSHYSSGTSKCGYCGKEYDKKDGWSTVMRIVQPSPNGSYCSRKCANDFIRSL